MDVDKRAQIQADVEQIAKPLYLETNPAHVNTLGGIEFIVQAHLLELVGPDIEPFLSAAATATQRVVESSGLGGA